MAKFADKYFTTDPWNIIEEGFNPAYSFVSESIFSLANEYMGVRGYFEEGYRGQSLIGSYFNGIYETQKLTGSGYKGMVDQTEFIVNSVDWLFLRIEADTEKLDLAVSEFKDFKRVLDLRTGILNRSFLWILQNGKEIKVEFERFLSMKDAHMAGQRLLLTPLNFSGEVKVTAGLDFSRPHQMVGRNMWECKEIKTGEKWCSILADTRNTGLSVYSFCRFEGNAVKEENQFDEMKSLKQFTLSLKQSEASGLTRIVTNVTNKDLSPEGCNQFNVKCGRVKQSSLRTDYDSLKKESKKWWKEMWKNSDICIDGDERNQQGIRYCIFQMHQTCHGADKGTIIGAKGLTGEVYSGNTFWDTETYCLPFYLFNNPEAAKNLILYRCSTRKEAMERARALDCKGAFYPIATISGRECCSLWQHANLQLQASTAVVYALWHYENVTKDTQFIYDYGVPVLIEVSRMLASRGDWDAAHKTYGYYGVMGPDEFQMMVNNNCYTNYMGKTTLAYTLEVLSGLELKSAAAYQEVCKEHGLGKEELLEWKNISDHMYIPHDENTLIFEQHDGYFKLPHVDVDAIPPEDFPLYHHWTYDRIYRNDMIKQPDVLMFMLMHNGRFTHEQLLKNYEFYEPRCIHESSLSPSVHSILAVQLHKHEEGYEFFGFATRMDLDNYNRNTSEGLHTTSIAAAWMNIVYGFGGMRSDQALLSFSPSIPKVWKGYSFRVKYREDVIQVEIDKENANFSTRNGSEITISVYGRPVKCCGEKTRVMIPAEWRG